MGDWYPHDGPQRIFCTRGEFEVLFGGAAGPGKTDCLIMEGARFVDFPDYRGLILRRTFPQLQEIIDRCWEYYPRIGGEYRATEHRWYFKDGGRIQLGHMQHENDKYNYQGKEYHFCVHPETEVLLPNGSYKKIIDLCIGEKVQTLIGPKPITHKFENIIKPSITITANGMTQIQSHNHKLMFSLPDASGMFGVFRPCEIFSPKESHSCQQFASRSSQIFQSEQQLHEDQPLCQGHISKQAKLRQDHQFLSEYVCDMVSQGQGIYSLGLCGNNQDALQQVLFLQSVLGHPVPVSVSGGFPSSQHFLTHENADVQPCSSQLSCQGYCLGDFHQHGGLLLVDEDHDQSYFLRQDDVEPPTPIDFADGDQGKTPKHNPHKLRWLHPYKKDVHCSQIHAQPFSFYSCDIGLQKLVDIRVKDASSYITKGGFVNSNCGFDEVTQFTETQYLYMQSRVRTTDKRIPMRIRATTNPGGIGHVWCKKRFVDVTDPTTTYIDPATGNSRAFIPATVYDNPSLVENDPLYVRRLEALPEIEKKRLLFGIWDVFEGQVFTELSQRVHGCEDFKIPPEWEKVMVFDWGYARPFCCLWFAIDFDGVAYLYRELYGMKDDDPDKGLRLNNDQICKMIFEAESEKVRFRVADPACWSPTKIKGSNKVHGPSFIEDASKQGLFFLKADNDRIRGVQQFHQRLGLDQETDSDGVVINETPRFIAFNSCKRWWEEVTELYEDPKNPEDVDTKQPDEGYDCLHGDTEVETKTGTYKIKDLVGEKGEVKTVFGLWTKFTNCKMYGKDRDVIRVNFTDGTHIICTPDHRFLTEDLGWKEGRDLKCNQKLYQKRYRSLMESVITYRVSTWEDMSNSIGLYGNTIMGIYLRCTLSITKTVTRLIIGLKILNSCIGINITQSRQKKQITPTGLKPCKMERRNGMVQKRVLSGTRAITKKIVNQRCTKHMRLIVCSVVKNFMDTLTPSFAVTTANQSGAESTNMTTLNEHALCVENGFQQTNTLPSKHAQGGVGENFKAKQKQVLSIENAGKSDVYCLTAIKTHAFEVNGVMVSNCARYFFMSRPLTPPKLKEKAPPGSFTAERNRLLRAKKYASRHGVSLAAAYGRIR